MRHYTLFSKYTKCCHCEPFFGEAVSSPLRGDCFTRKERSFAMTERDFR